MDLSCDPYVAREMVPMETEIGRADILLGDGDGTDSDDLQFVDDLNVEPEPLELSQTGTQEQINLPPVAEPVSIDSVTPNVESLPPRCEIATDSVTDHCNPVSGSAVPAVPAVPTAADHKADTIVLNLPTVGTSQSETILTNNDSQVSEITVKTYLTRQISNSSSKMNISDVESSQKSESEKPDISSQPVEPSATKPTIVQTIIKHFIEGFTIEESTEPFPVHRSSLLTELKQRTKKKVSRRRTIAGSAISRSPAAKAATQTSPHRPTLTKAQAAASLIAYHTPISHAVSVDGVPAASAWSEYQKFEMMRTGELEICAMCGKDCVNLCFYRGDSYCSRPCIKKRKATLFANPETAPPKRGRPVGAMTRNKPTNRNSGKLAKFSRYRPKSSLSDSSDKGAPSAGIKQEPFPHFSSPDDLNATVFSPDPLATTLFAGAHFPLENGYESEDSLLQGSEAMFPAHGYKRADIVRWTVSDVRDFIQSLSGCERYAFDFEEQEIDGRALLLLNEDHLLNALDIKLGPALKIYSHINSFR